MLFPGRPCASEKSRATVAFFADRSAAAKQAAANKSIDVDKKSRVLDRVKKTSHNLASLLITKSRNRTKSANAGRRRESANAL
jgi:hypothetical protein